MAAAPFLPAPEPRFQGWDSKWFLTGGLPAIKVRKLMARIRITQEAMDDMNRGTFADAYREECRAVMADIVRAEERYLL